jgi:ABC-2 type transport system permease protein
VVDAVASLSILTHFSSLTRGVLDLRDIAYFIVGITALVLATSFLIDWKKSA